MVVKSTWEPEQAPEGLGEVSEPTDMCPVEPYIQITFKKWSHLGTGEVTQWS